MAHYYSPFIMVLFLCIAPCAYSNTPSISDICSKHNNPRFCHDVLNAKHGANLPSLAEYVIEMVQIRVGSTKAALELMVRQTLETRLIQHYKSCSYHYKEAQDSVKKVKDCLKSHDYFGMDVAASAVMTNIDDCASSEAPGYDPSVFLVKTNQDLENLSVIIMIIANHLSGKY